MADSSPRLLTRVSRRLTRMTRGMRRRAGDLAKLISPRCPVVGNTGLVSYQSIRSPLTRFDLTNARIVHTMDFLPDRLSFSGMPFGDCPQADFARRYVSDANFDYRATRYFQLAAAGKLPFPCSGEMQAVQRCQEFIHLINRLKDLGYQPAEHGAISLVERADGSHMVVNGKHRLAALMALGETHIDVFMGHANEVAIQFQHLADNCWPRSSYARSIAAFQSVGRTNAEKRDRIAGLIGDIRAAKLETWAEIYHPIPFTDFRHLSTQVTPDTPYRRLEMILSHSGDLVGKRVLDLGCNLGFYSFSLARRGAKCTGVELREDYMRIAPQIAAIYDMPVTFVNESLSPELIDRVGDVDVTLCFSMIQWVIDQKGMDHGKAILRRISERSRRLFFDVSVNEGKACLTCRPGDELAYADRLLRESTGFSHIDYIGKVHPYRTDVRHVFHCHHGD